MIDEFWKLNERVYAYYFRPLPPLPNLEMSEETAIKAADEMRVWVNYALSIAHDIAIRGNWRLFFKVFYLACSDWCFVCQSWLFQLLILDSMVLAMLIRLLQSCGSFPSLVVSSTFLRWFTLVSMNSVVCCICISYSSNSNPFLFGIILQQVLFLVYHCLCCMTSTKSQLMISWVLHIILLRYSMRRLIASYFKRFPYLQTRRRRPSRPIVISFLHLMSC